MSLFNHLKRSSKHDKSGSSSRSNSVEPSREIPRIVTTTHAPSIVNRDLLKPSMSRPQAQDRAVSTTSAFSAASESTIAPEENSRNRTSILDRAKSAIRSRSASRSPSESPDDATRKQLAPRGNHIVTDAVATFRVKLQAEVKGTEEQILSAGVSSENLFGFIANERLRRMPARGSRWDKILKWAEDFAKKLSLFEVADENFIPSSKEAVELILASIQLLLLVSPSFYSLFPEGNPANMFDSLARRTARRWRGPSASTTSMALPSTFINVISAFSSPSQRPGGTSVCRWPTCLGFRLR